VLRTVRVWGFTPEPIEVKTAVATGFQVIEAVGRQIKELAPDPVLGPKQIVLVGYRTVEDLAGPLKDGDVNIVPLFAGAKKGLFQILLGGLLVALSFMVGMPWLSSFLLKVGALMVLGGISQLLNPTPKADGDGNDESRYMGPPKNTVQIGTRIPIIYGRYQWGGQYLSYDVNAQMVIPYGAEDEDDE
jgi:predicted phage tail protein